MSLINIRPAEPRDIPFIFTLIRELAIYEKLLNQVVLTEETLCKSLFPENLSKKVAHALVAEFSSSRT